VKCIALHGTGRRVLEQEKQVTNWIKSGGHVPRRYFENNDRETTGLHRAGRWKIPPAIGAALLALPLACGPGQARDPDGRYANSPLKQWFDSLKSGRGPCCSDADGSAVSDVDWESKDGATAFVLKASGMRYPRMPSSPSRTGSVEPWSGRSRAIWE